MREDDLLSCSCCGNGIKHNAVENTCYGKVPYPHDEGYGMCRSCGGDPNAVTVRKKLGWAACMFVDARIPIVLKALKPEQKEHFEKLPYVKKVAVIYKMVEKGMMI